MPVTVSRYSRPNPFLRTAVQGCVLRPLCTGDAGTSQDRQRSLPAVSPGQPGYSGAWLDLNQRPHPYQLSRAKRCADRPFPRSRPTIAATVMRSIRAQVCAPPKRVEYHWRCTHHCLGLPHALLCTAVHLHVSLLHHLGVLITQTSHPMMDALELRPARCSASPAALACPVGGGAQQVQPAGRADPRSCCPRVEPQRLGLFGR
jgi:hypothetical protein